MFRSEAEERKAPEEILNNPGSQGGSGAAQGGRPAAPRGPTLPDFTGCGLPKLDSKNAPNWECFICRHVALGFLLHES